MNPQDPNQTPAPAVPVPNPIPAPAPTPTPAPIPAPAPGPGTAAPVVHNPLAVMQKGETVICEIKRHPIGVFAIYVVSGVVLIVLAIIAFVIAPMYITSVSSAEVLGVSALGFLLFAVLTVGFVLIGNIVYWGNRWIVTSDSLTQVTQTSLFHKQSSQLSLGNLEDITAEQNGILPHLFNYGVIKAETAGERSKFVFLFCPRPNYYAQQILGARERFEQDRQGDKTRYTDYDPGVNVGTQ